MKIFNESISIKAKIHNKFNEKLNTGNEKLRIINVKFLKFSTLCAIVYVRVCNILFILFVVYVLKYTKHDTRRFVYLYGRSSSNPGTSGYCISA